MGCAAGGRWWFSWSLVVVWKWLWPLRVVVVVVRRSWAFVGRLSSFLGGLGRLRGLGLWEVAWGCRGGRADAHHRWAMCCGGQRCGYVVVVG